MLFIIKKQFEVIERQNALKDDIVAMRQLQDDIVRAQASYATEKDIGKLLKERGVNLDEIEKDLKTLDSSIKAVSTATVATPGIYEKNLASTNTTPGPRVNETFVVDCSKQTGIVNCPNSDKNGYLNERQELQLVEPFQNDKKVPWGNVGFSAWQEKPWDLKVHPRKYETTTIISTDEEGRHFAHTQMSVEADGKRHTVPIENAKIVEKYPESEFRFSPRLYMAMDGGMTANAPAHAEGMASLQIALWSYGRTRQDATWTFIGLGLGYHVVNKTVGVVLAPINYNLGKHLPLVDNIFFGPSVSADLNGDISIMGGVRVGL